MSISAPKLRFNAFGDDWALKPLYHVADIIAGYAFPSNNMHQVRKKYQIIKMSNVYKSQLRLDRNPSYWESVDEKLKKFVINKNDILITLTGTVGKTDYGYSILIEDDDMFLLNQRIVSLRSKLELSDSYFLYNAIKPELCIRIEKGRT